MRHEYHYIVSGLPDLKPDDRKVDLTLGELKMQLDEHVSGKDLALVNLFFLPEDHKNILKRLYGLSYHDSLASVYKAEMIDELIVSARLKRDDTFDIEPYVVYAVKEFFSQQQPPRLSLFEARMNDGWARKVSSCGNAFAIKYISFDTTLRNVMIALQGRKYNMDVTHSIVGTDDIAEQIRKNRQSDFGLKGDWDYLEPALQIFSCPDLVEREMRIDALRWTFIDEASFFDYFTIEKIIATILKLGMIERWSSLDTEEGKSRFSEMIRSYKRLTIQDNTISQL